jgi:dTDP-glucose 4,6-dehydratase
VRVLVTGGAGFIGSNLVRLLLDERPGWRVVVLDKLTYAGNLESLADVAARPGYRFVRGDVSDAPLVRALLAEERIEAVLHLAAESHVDRSIAAPAVFIETNVGGTQVLLDAARESRVARFVHVSTDEVYGSLGAAGRFTEASPLAPSSPYSASKAGGDLLALAYARTFGLDVVVTRCSNNYGPYQFPEKLVPLVIVNALRDLPLPVYGDGGNVRDWIHVEDHARGLLAALERGRAGEVYLLGASSERRNLAVVEAILDALGKPRALIRFVEDRLGHDRRYALDASKARRELDWAPGHAFEAGLAATVRWYVEHRSWWERVLSGAYRRAWP